MEAPKPAENDRRKRVIEHLARFHEALLPGVVLVDAERAEPLPSTNVSHPNTCETTQA